MIPSECPAENRRTAVVAVIHSVIEGPTLREDCVIASHLRHVFPSLHAEMPKMCEEGDLFGFSEDLPAAIEELDVCHEARCGRGGWLAKRDNRPGRYFFNGNLYCWSPLVARMMSETEIMGFKAMMEGLCKRYVLGPERKLARA